ncbi:MAG: hypothetical protein AAB267_10225 [Candidatus Desantisbacteria bacterium]
MNFYICALEATIFSILIFFLWKKQWIKGREYLLLYIFISLPLSALVNIFVKGPIFIYLLKIFNIGEGAKWPLWFLFVISIIGPLCEEVIKILPLIIMLKIASMDGLKIYLLGMLLGIGFGIGEAFYLGYSFTIAMPEYISGLKNLLLVSSGFGGERLLAITIHWFLTATVAFGIVMKKPIRYFSLAVLLHFLINIPACLYQDYGMPAQICGVLTVIIFLVLFFSVFLKIEERVRLGYEKPASQKEEKVLYERRD